MARPGQKILEPLCGSGRFLIPFMERGLDITGVDLSRPMLDKLREKAPDARAVLADLTQYAPEERCDYIFIPAGSLGLFTELDTCMAVLKKIRSWLAPGGQFVFSVDTVWARSGEDDAFREAARVPAGVYSSVRQSLIILIPAQTASIASDRRTDMPYAPVIVPLAISFI